jgi:primosomal protein N'
MSINDYQPDPVGNGTKVLDQVMADLAERAENGKEKYGVYLRTHNGRDALIDAYQEALDLVMYLRQAIMEREETDDSSTA